MNERAAKVSAFMDDLSRLSEAQPEIFESGVIAVFPAQKKIGILPENQCDIDLDALRADVPESGWGKTVLRLLTALADRHHVDLYVKAMADDEQESPDSISQGDLEAFYASMGFIDVGSWAVRDMVRRASAPENVDPETADFLTAAMTGATVWSRPRAAKL